MNVRPEVRRRHINPPPTVFPRVKGACREWLTRGSLTREEVSELVTGAVLVAVRQGGRR